MLNTEGLRIYGDREAAECFVQLVDEHDPENLQTEAQLLSEALGPVGWQLAALPVGDWFRDLPPWPAAPVFGRQAFGGGAAATLEQLIGQAMPALEGGHPLPARRYYLCGYSLAGLFALWAGCRTDRFAGIVAASPSVWYPEWSGWAETHAMQAPRVYLSLGDREERTRNPVMATVGNAIRRQHRLLTDVGVDCRLEWNPGNHFADPDQRTARGMIWMVKENF